MVHDAAPDQNVHPDSILLAGVQVFDAQRPAVEPREGQVRTVILRAHEAVELVVVEVGEPVLELRGLVVQPFGETAPYILDLGTRELYFLPVAHLHVLPFAIHEPAYRLGDLGRGVLQGVLDQVQAAVMAELAIDGVLFAYLDRVRVGRLDVEFVDVGYVDDFHLRFEEPRGEALVDAHRYPPFPEVEVQVLEGDRLGRSFAQRREGRLRRRMVGILLQKTFHPVGLLDDVARDDALGDLVLVAVRVEIDTSFELFQYLRFARPGKLRYILHVHVGIAVQAGRQRRKYIVGLLYFFRSKGYGTVENIGFVRHAVRVPFQGEDLFAPGIHFNKVDVLRSVELSEPLREVVIEAVQHPAQGGVRLLPVRLDVIEVVVGVAQLDIDRCLHALLFR